MDGFHLAGRELERLGRADRKGAPDTFDVDGYVDLLDRLRRATSTVYAPEFRRDLEEPIAGAIAVEAHHTTVITEGNYLLLDGGGWERVRPLLTECWFVECDERERSHATGRTPRGAWSIAGRGPALGRTHRRAERPADRGDPAARRSRRSRRRLRRMSGRGCRPHAGRSPVGHSAAHRSSRRRCLRRPSSLSSGGDGWRSVPRTRQQLERVGRHRSQWSDGRRDRRPTTGRVEDRRMERHETLELFMSTRPALLQPSASRTPLL